MATLEKRIYTLIRAARGMGVLSGMFWSGDAWALEPSKAVFFTNQRELRQHVKRLTKARIKVVLPTI